MTVNLIDFWRFRCRGGGWNVGRWKARMSSCPEIIPEQLKSHYFNERHDIVSIGVIQPCGQSKQLSVSSKHSPISDKSWQISGYMSTFHFGFLLCLSLLLQETPQMVPTSHPAGFLSLQQLSPACSSSCVLVKCH